MFFFINIMTKQQSSGFQLVKVTTGWLKPRIEKISPKLFNRKKSSGRRSCQSPRFLQQNYKTNKKKNMTFHTCFQRIRNFCLKYTNFGQLCCISPKGLATFVSSCCREPPTNIMDNLSYGSSDETKHASIGLYEVPQRTLFAKG